MSMDAQDWADLATVYQAGSDRARGWSGNPDRQQDAEILEAQADRCREIAREREGNPPAEHEHYHYHTSPDGTDRLMHRHPHTHGRGETDHDHGHPPGRDPFAPLPSLLGDR
jgi:hypothetical protein